jgi:hypothetical protein
VYRARTVPDMLNPPKPIIINQPWETFFGGKVTFARKTTNKINGLFL